jgi:hypothetical protein
MGFLGMTELPAEGKTEEFVYRPTPVVLRALGQKLQGPLRRDASETLMARALMTCLGFGVILPLVAAGG